MKHSYQVKGGGQERGPGRDRGLLTRHAVLAAGLFMLLYWYLIMRDNG